MAEEEKRGKPAEAAGETTLEVEKTAGSSPTDTQNSTPNTKHKGTDNPSFDMTVEIAMKNLTETEKSAKISDQGDVSLALDDESDLEVEDDDDQGNWFSKCIVVLQSIVKRIIILFSGRFSGLFRLSLLILYFTYFTYAMYVRFGDEGSIRLLACTAFGILLLSSRYFRRYLLPNLTAKCSCEFNRKQVDRIFIIIRWFLYIATAVFIVTFTVVDVALQNPQNLTSLTGLLFLILGCCLFSQRPSKISWRTIYWSMGLQYFLALFILRSNFGQQSIQWLTDRVNEFLNNAFEASEFVFGEKYVDHRLLFGAFPSILYINAFVALLYYVGVIQWFVRVIGGFLAFTLDISPAEAMCVATNLILDSPTTGIAMKPYILTMSRSELFTVFVAGQATVSGAFLGIVTSFGISMSYLIPASVMSAPATVAVSKILLPEAKRRVFSKKKYDIGEYAYTSVLEAALQGAISALSVLANIVVNIYVFVGMLYFFNNTLEWFGDRVGVENFTFEFLSSYVLWPFPAMMGADLGDCRDIAKLIGYKVMGSATYSYLQLSGMSKNRITFNNYILATNGSWEEVGADIYLNEWNRTLTSGFLSERSEAIATYALCGLSNIVSVGSALALFYIILPKKREFVTKTAIPSVIAGNVACFMTACFAGLFYQETVR